MLKNSLALTMAKSIDALIRLTKRGSGTSLPGKMALKIAPGLLHDLAKQVTGQTVAITGTNGKSTTAGLLAALIEQSGEHVIHNQLGANMLSGITTALAKQSNLLGTLKADKAVLEVDEASLPKVAMAVGQAYTVVTNLFRDQLDRYGELDTTAAMIRQGIENSGGQLILNADDPMVASIGQHFPAEKVRYFGVNQVLYPTETPITCAVPFPKEVTDCPLCQAALVYTQEIYGHLGHYACPQCGFSRPKPDIEAQQIAVNTTQSTLTLSLNGQQPLTLNLPIPGLFNAYNLLAAITAAQAIGIESQGYQAALNTYHSIFGRAEKREIDGKTVMIFLIKNPIGTQEVLKVVTADPNAQLLIAINDNDADGRDVSWLWDAPFELLANTTHPIVVSGQRAHDMSVRLKYAGVPKANIVCHPQLDTAIKSSLHTLGPQQTLYILPTYTVLLSLKNAMA